MSTTVLDNNQLNWERAIKHCLPLVMNLHAEALENLTFNPVSEK